MQHPSRECRGYRIATVVLASILFVASLAATGERLWHDLRARLIFSGAVHSISNLCNQYHVYWREHKSWPAPGAIVGDRGATYLNSRNGPTRIDRFSLLGDHLVDVYLSDAGDVEVLRDPDDTH